MLLLLLVVLFDPPEAPASPHGRRTDRQKRESVKYRDSNLTGTYWARRPATGPGPPMIGRRTLAVISQADRRWTSICRDRRNAGTSISPVNRQTREPANREMQGATSNLRHVRRHASEIGESGRATEIGDADTAHDAKRRWL